MWAKLQSFGRNPVLAMCVLAAVLTVLLVQTYHRAYRPDGYDLTSYLLSSKALCSGANPYKTDTPYPHPYPLFLAFLLIPLTAMPYWLVNFIWFALSVTCLFSASVLLLKIGSDETKSPIGPGLAVPGLAIFLVMLLPIQNTLLNGQVNLIVLFCCVMFLRYLTRNQKIPAAAWLGAAISLKLVPVVLLLYVLLRRQYGVILWSMFFFAIFCLLPGVVAGKNLLTYYKSYADSYLFPAISSHAYDRIVPFSFQGVFEHFLPAARAGLLAKAIGAAATLVAILSVDVAGRSREDKKCGQDVWTFCACLLGCLFLSPISEIHHLVLAIPAVLLVGFKVFYDRQWAVKAVLVLTALFVLCFDIMPRAYENVPFYFFSLITLLVLLVLAARNSKPRLPASALMANADCDIL